MPTTRVSSKGQITIPKAVREALGIREGDELLLRVERGEMHAQVIKRRRLTELYGALPATKPYEEIGLVRHLVRKKMAQRRLRSSDDDD